MEQVKAQPETRPQILDKARTRAIKDWCAESHKRGMGHKLTEQAREVITRIDFLIKIETEAAKAERYGFSIDQAIYWAAASGSGGL